MRSLHSIFCRFILSSVIILRSSHRAHHRLHLEADVQMTMSAALTEQKICENEVPCEKKNKSKDFRAFECRFKIPFMAQSLRYYADDKFIWNK